MQNNQAVWRSAMQELNTFIRCIVMENNAMPQHVYVDNTALEEIKRIMIEAGAMSQGDTECRVQVYPLPHPIVIRPFAELSQVAGVM